MPAQVDIALRAEAALTQLAVTSQGTQAGLIKQLQEARATAEAATQGRAQVEAELERLHTERSSFTQQISALEKEAAAARAALQDDRATLAETVRAAAAKEEGLEDLVNRLRADNEQLTQQVSSLQRRLEEESEVVEAARNQLYDYRQMVGVVRSGRGERVGSHGRAATVTLAPRPTRLNRCCPPTPTRPPAAPEPAPERQEQAGRRRRGQEPRAGEPHARRPRLVAQRLQHPRCAVLLWQSTLWGAAWEVEGEGETPTLTCRPATKHPTSPRAHHACRPRAGGPRHQHAHQRRQPEL